MNYFVKYAITLPQGYSTVCLSTPCDFSVESASDLDPDPDPDPDSDPDPPFSEDRDPKGVLAPVDRKIDSLLPSMNTEVNLKKDSDEEESMNALTIKKLKGQ